MGEGRSKCNRIVGLDWPDTWEGVRVARIESRNALLSPETKVTKSHLINAARRKFDFPQGLKEAAEKAENRSLAG